MKKIKRAIQFNLLLNKSPKIILGQTKKEKNIVYGAQSIKKQTGLWGRDTFDFDIFSRKPIISARKTERKLDKNVDGDSFFVEKAKHKGTYKVKYVGYDLKKNTKDDISMVDYTGMPYPLPKTKIINGVRYRELSEEERKKIKILKQKSMKFRHQKDRDDLNRIKFSNLLKKRRY